jgi:integrase/recombinase XerD
MAQQTTPKQMARRLARVLRDERPDYSYLKKVFQHIRALLAVKPGKVQKRLPHLLTDQELVAFYETVWQARDPVHMILIKLLIFTGLRNAELANVQLSDVDLDNCQIRVDRGKGGKDRSVLFPGSFRGELAQYLRGQQERGALYLFESNRLKPYSTRRIRQIIHQYAASSGIKKRIYPITFLTRRGIISPKLQLLSGHTDEKNLEIYRDLALADVSTEYQEAMRTFPIR